MASGSCHPPPMTKRRLILAVLGLGILAALLFAFTRPREPSYKGRSLSQWVEDYGTPPKMTLSRQQEVAAQAIRAIGTNALPFLLRWIKYEAPPPVREGSAPRDEADLRADDAVRAFAIIGPDARCALPELTAILTRTVPGVTFANTRAGHAMAAIGPAALPAFCAALTNQSPAVREVAALTIYDLGTNARPAAPDLIRTLSDPKFGPAHNAAWALGHLAPNPPSALLILSRIRAIPNGLHREIITQAFLAEYTTTGQAAERDLLTVLNDADPSLRDLTTNILAKIAAARRPQQSNGTSRQKLTNAPPK
jgi:hypothetical protein